MIIQYIFDIDLKGFLFKFKIMKDIVNYIFELRDTKCVGKLWIYQFIKCRIKLKMCFNYIYNFQRAFYKDSKFIEK